MATNYQQYRDAQIKSGALFQDFVTEVCASHVNLIIQIYSSKEFQWNIGESRQGVEIKFDDKFATTGNLWIEIAEKARPREGDYATSGIYRTDNTWLYLIGNYDTIFIFPKNILQMLHLAERYKVMENNLKTSKGFLLPRADAERYSCLILKPQATEKVARIVKNTVAYARDLRKLLDADARQNSLFPRIEEIERGIVVRT